MKTLTQFDEDEYTVRFPRKNAIIGRDWPSESLDVDEAVEIWRSTQGIYSSGSHVMSAAINSARHISLRLDHLSMLERTDKPNGLMLGHHYDFIMDAGLPNALVEVEYDAPLIGAMSAWFDDALRTRRAIAAPGNAQLADGVLQEAAIRGLRRPNVSERRGGIAIEFEAADRQLFVLLRGDDCFLSVFGPGKDLSATYELKNKDGYSSALAQIKAELDQLA